MSKKSKNTPSPSPVTATATTAATQLTQDQTTGWVFPWRAMGVILIVQTLALVMAAKSNLDQLNNDAIAYLRLGEYYAQGNLDLAVSGYWGPMLSWLIAAGIKLGFSPMAAGRAVMALSGLVFSAGAIGLLRGVRMNGWPAILSAAIAACATIFWSVQYVSPDLLVSGLMLGTWGILFTGSWNASRKWPVIAGVFWGMAYLAKAVAFPLAVVVTVMVAGLRMLTDGDKKRLMTSAGITIAVFALVAAPWVLTLSAKYGHFTFSTSGKINHSIVGPEDVDRYHPVFRTFHQPDAGRVTQWEDPSRMDYKPWSVLKNSGHQLKLMRKNLDTVIVHLASFSLLFLGIISLIAALYVPRPWRERLACDRWRWTLVPLACLCGIYLPVWVAPFDDRYFYAALPVLLITSFGVLASLQKALDGQRWVNSVGGTLVVLAFGAYPLLYASIAPTGLRHDTTGFARVMAEAIQKEGVAGPIAGSGTVLGNRTGLFTAYLLGVPWLGDRKAPTAEDYQNSTAQILILESDTPAAKNLTQDPRWRRVEVQFPTVVELDYVPLVVLVRK